MKEETINFNVSVKILYPEGKREEAVKTAIKTVSYTEIAEGKDNWVVFAEVAKVEENILTSDMSAFLLVNILRNLTDEQQAQLCADIYVRSSKKDYIDNRIKEMKED